MINQGQNKNRNHVNIGIPFKFIYYAGADPGFCQGGWLADPKNLGGSSRGVWGHAPPEDF